MAADSSSGMTPSLPFTTAAAPLIAASAAIRSRDSGSPETWKFSTARWVCAPHSASSGTATSPMESCSIRNPARGLVGSVTVTASGSARSGTNRQQRLLR